MAKRGVYSLEDGSVLIVTSTAECGISIEQIMEKDVPSNYKVFIVDASELPNTVIGRVSLRLDEDGNLFNDLKAAKYIAHDIRRARREQELEPLDTRMCKQIPSDNLIELEAQRQVIRDKYDALQASIEGCNTFAEVESLVSTVMD